MKSNVSRRRVLQVLAAGAATTSGAISGCSGANSGDPEPFDDVIAGKASALQVGTLQPIAGAPVFIARDADGLYAMTTTCSHAGCDLSRQGTISSSDISCGCHHSRFDLNGGVLRGPASSPLTHFAVEVASDGTITAHGGTTVSASTRTPAA